MARHRPREYNTLTLTATPDAPIRFGIVGTGWRALFYLRIARARPDLFDVCGVVSRRPEAPGTFGKEWGVSVFPDLDTFLKSTSPRFVVTSVPWSVNPNLLRSLAERKVPALSETPPAPDVEGLVSLNADIARLGGKVQVAEEYHLRPNNAAQIAMAESGLLGAISHAQVSVGHGYHGISLMRRLLKVGYEPAQITSFEFKAPILAGPGRDATPNSEQTRESSQEIYIYRFAGRSGVMDFTGDQYFGSIRQERLLARGERGEIMNSSAIYMKDHVTPVSLKLARRTQDILSGVALLDIRAGERLLYTNPFAPAPITDDEIAIASCLTKMNEYILTGKTFYPLAEGSQDHYLYLLSQQSAREGRPIEAVRQPWA